MRRGGEPGGEWPVAEQKRAQREAAANVFKLQAERERRREENRENRDAAARQRGFREASEIMGLSKQDLGTAARARKKRGAAS